MLESLLVGAIYVHTWFIPSCDYSFGPGTVLTEETVINRGFCRIIQVDLDSEGVYTVYCEEL